MEHEAEREELLDSIRNQNKELQLWEQVRLSHRAYFARNLCSCWRYNRMTPTLPQKQHIYYLRIVDLVANEGKA